jgi:DNA-binding CsgD family transcriptional regulator
MEETKSCKDAGNRLSCAMTYIFIELAQTITHATVLYILFIKLNQPDSRRKRIAAYVIMVLANPLLIVWYDMVEQVNEALNIFIYMLPFLATASLCNRDGDKLQSIISAVYASGMLILLNFTVSGYCLAIFGFEAIANRYTWSSNIFQLTLNALFVLWTIFYYRVSRKSVRSVPLSFSALITLMPTIAIIIIVIIISQLRPVFGDEAVRASGVFLYSGLLGSLILVSNMVILYMYVRLSAAYESIRFAQSLANTPPVWTAEQGLSTLFINKYQISPREAQVIETLLLGKSDKEIATQLELAVNTVQAHLKRIYKKTGVAGRFALATLVRGAE